LGIKFDVMFWVGIVRRFSENWKIVEVMLITSWSLTFGSLYGGQLGRNRGGAVSVMPATLMVSLGDAVTSSMVALEASASDTARGGTCILIDMTGLEPGMESD
jgi:hypothetical protein